MGPDGPILLHDVHFLNQMAHFNRERVPERNVHAQGSGAFGEFETTEDVSAYTKAALFQKGVKTEMLARLLGGVTGDVLERAFQYWKHVDAATGQRIEELVRSRSEGAAPGTQPQAARADAGEPIVEPRTHAHK